MLVNSSSHSPTTEEHAQTTTWSLGWHSVSKVLSSNTIPYLISGFYRVVRNVYTLFDYGDFIQDSTTLADPYIQLLSITSTSEGIYSSDFLPSGHAFDNDWILSHV